MSGDLLKVLYCSFDVIPEPTGSSARASDFIRGLTPLFNVDGLTVKSADHGHIERYHGMRLMRVPVGAGDLPVKAQTFERAVRRQLESDEYQLVHFTDPFGGYALCELRQQHNFKLVYEVMGFPSIEVKYTHPHLESDKRFMAKLRRQELFCLMNADAVLVGSEQTASLVRSLGVSSDRTVVVPATADVSHYSPIGELALPDRMPMRLLYLGNQNAWQGLSTLLFAMSIATQLTEVRLAIVGPQHPTWRLQLEEMVKYRKLTGQVEFIDPVPYDDLPKLIASADVGVAPLERVDRNTVQGAAVTKIAHYLAAGRPVIASNLPIVREVAHDSCALFHEPGDENDLAEKIVMLARDPARRVAMGARGHAFAREKLHADLGRTRLLRLYSTLLGAEDVPAGAPAPAEGEASYAPTSVGERVRDEATQTGVGVEFTDRRSPAPFEGRSGTDTSEPASVEISPELAADGPPTPRGMPSVEVTPPQAPPVAVESAEEPDLPIDDVDPLEFDFGAGEGAAPPQVLAIAEPEIPSSLLPGADLRSDVPEVAKSELEAHFEDAGGPEHEPEHEPEQEEDDDIEVSADSETIVPGQMLSPFQRPPQVDLSKTMVGGPSVDLSKTMMGGPQVDLSKTMVGGPSVDLSKTMVGGPSVDLSKTMMMGAAEHLPPVAPVPKPAPRPEPEPEELEPPPGVLVEERPLPTAGPSPIPEEVPDNVNEPELDTEVMLDIPVPLLASTARPLANVPWDLEPEGEAERLAALAEVERVLRAEVVPAEPVSLPVAGPLVMAVDDEDVSVVEEISAIDVAEGTVLEEASPDEVIEFDEVEPSLPITPVTPRPPEVAPAPGVPRAPPPAILPKPPPPVAPVASPVAAPAAKAPVAPPKAAAPVVQPKPAASPVKTSPTPVPLVPKPAPAPAPVKPAAPAPLPASVPAPVVAAPRPQAPASPAKPVVPTLTPAKPASPAPAATSLPPVSTAANARSLASTMRIPVVGPPVQPLAPTPAAPASPAAGGPPVLTPVVPRAPAPARSTAPGKPEPARPSAGPPVLYPSASPNPVAKGAPVPGVGPKPSSADNLPKLTRVTPGSPAGGPPVLTPARTSQPFPAPSTSDEPVEVDSSDLESLTPNSGVPASDEWLGHVLLGYAPFSVSSRRTFSGEAPAVEPVRRNGENPKR